MTRTGRNLAFACIEEEVGFHSFPPRPLNRVPELCAASGSMSCGAWYRATLATSSSRASRCRLRLACHRSVSGVVRFAASAAGILRRVRAPRSGARTYPLSSQRALATPSAARARALRCRSRNVRVYEDLLRGWPLCRCRHRARACAAQSLRLCIGTTGCLDAFFRTHVEKYVRLCVSHVKKAFFLKEGLPGNELLRKRLNVLLDDLAFSHEQWASV